MVGERAAFVEPRGAPPRGCGVGGGQCGSDWALLPVALRNGDAHGLAAPPIAAAFCGIKQKPGLLEGLLPRSRRLALDRPAHIAGQNGDISFAYRSQITLPKTSCDQLA